VAGWLAGWLGEASADDRWRFAGWFIRRGSEAQDTAKQSLDSRSPDLEDCDVPDTGMAALRRGHEPMRLDVPKSQVSNLPFISALFLIRFDVKTGYAISWKRALPGIGLEGDVEYKSLPSGLHTVKEDLVYFVHGKHAGLSAFISVAATEEARNARMIAVGVLVPLSYGRLGRSWKHAENLKAFAEYVPFVHDMAGRLLTYISESLPLNLPTWHYSTIIGLCINSKMVKARRTLSNLSTHLRA